MSPTRWVLPRASFLALLITSFAASIASAQILQSTPNALDLARSTTAQSPRLLGMGGLSLVVPDRDAAINLWDFAGLPAGLASDDSTSTLYLRPGTRSLSSARNLASGGERQNLAARGNDCRFEAVYRNRETGGAFGLIGDLSALSWDQPYATTIERRQGVQHPEAMPVLGGAVPKVFHGHLVWAAHMRFRSETVQNQYREIISNSAGQWINQGGGQLPPPGDFAPTRSEVSTNGYGLSTAYAVGLRTRLAVGIERENNRILSTNDQVRSSSEVRETRPYWTGRAAWVGSVGRTLEYGVVGTGRVSDSEADWRFTTSAGVGSDPLNGRGNLLNRKERSSELHARARWSPGRVTFAGSLTTAAHEITIDPPNANDLTSLNQFINNAYNRPGADTLALPDSIQRGVDKRAAWGWGGGAGYRFGRSTLGVEAHWSRDVRSTTALGSGPRRVVWDVRGGLERPLGDLMRGRLGYGYRGVDEDEYTAGNEYTSSTFSVGFGYAPTGAAWVLESGYAFELRNQDFGDPSDEHQTRQYLAAQLRWAF